MSVNQNVEDPFLVLRPSSSIKLVFTILILVGVLSFIPDGGYTYLEFGAMIATFFFLWGMVKLLYAATEVYEDRIVNRNRVLLRNEEITVVLRWEQIEWVSGALGWFPPIGLVFLEGKRGEKNVVTSIRLSWWFTNFDEAICHVIRKVDRSRISNEVLEYAKKIGCLDQS